MHRTQIGQPSHILHLKSTIAKMRRQKCKARPQEVTTPSSEVINYKVSFKKIVKSILNLETVLLWSELIYKSLKQVIVRRLIILEINPIQDLQFLKNEEKITINKLTTITKEQFLLRILTNAAPQSLTAQIKIIKFTQLLKSLQKTLFNLH